MYPADTDDVNRSHGPLAAKINVLNGVPQMNQYATVEEMQHLTSGEVTQLSKGHSELTMAHVDCNTGPLLWHTPAASRCLIMSFNTSSGPRQCVTSPSLPLKQETRSGRFALMNPTAIDRWSRRSGRWR